MNDNKAVSERCGSMQEKLEADKRHDRQFEDRRRRPIEIPNDVPECGECE